MKDITIRQFNDELASHNPTPGGGGAAALCGALGVALGSMVSNFTIGKAKYADVEDEIKELLNRTEELRIRFLDLIEEDAAAFEPLSKAYSITKDDPMRADLLESATSAAAIPPLNIMRACGEAIEILERLSEKGSVMMISDAGCGASLCKAAMESAAMNVFINTKSLIDTEHAGALNNEAVELMNKYIPMAENIVSGVTEFLIRRM